MSTDNPYQAPTTAVDVTPNKSDDVWAFVEPQKMPIGRGLGWIGDGFRFFGSNAGVWIAIAFVYFVMMVVSSFIPFATNILQPMLAGGLMIGLHNQDNGEPLEVRYLFEGFNTSAGNLAILGALIIGLSILIMIAMLVLFLIGFGIASVAQNTGGIEPFVVIALIIVGTPILIAVMFVVMSVSWFGPPLVALHDLSVGDAFKMSLLGLKRNILPFIVFSFFMSLLFVLTIFTLYLGLLVVLPVLMGASYASWKDVFTKANAL